MEIFRSTQWLEEATSKVAGYSHADGQEAPLSNRETRQKIWSHQEISDSVYFSKEISLSKEKKVILKRNEGATGGPSGVALEPKPKRPGADEMG